VSEDAGRADARVRGQERGDELFTVRDSLFRLAEDIGVSYRSLKDNRWTASRWPRDRRATGVSFTVHRIPAGIADEEERFSTIFTPPGKTRWTPDEANRWAGRQVVKPVTPQEKVSAIHTLAEDEAVAATVTGDLLRRPTVVAQVKQEDKVRAVEEPTRDDGIAATVMYGSASSAVSTPFASSPTAQIQAGSRRAFSCFDVTDRGRGSRRRRAPATGC
jgi:hypothetical protein